MFQVRCCIKKRLGHKWIHPTYRGINGQTYSLYMLRIYLHIWSKQRNCNFILSSCLQSKSIRYEKKKWMCNVEEKKRRVYVTCVWVYRFCLSLTTFLYKLLKYSLHFKLKNSLCSGHWCKSKFRLKQKKLGKIRFKDFVF